MRLFFRRSALADLTDVHDYIALDDATVAKSVIHRIRSCIERLELFPRSGRAGTLEGTHELVVPGLPYIVVYTIGGDEIDIRAIYHGAQDRPGSFRE